MGFFDFFRRTIINVNVHGNSGVVFISGLNGAPGQTPEVIDYQPQPQLTDDFRGCLEQYAPSTRTQYDNEYHQRHYGNLGGY